MSGSTVGLLPALKSMDGDAPSVLLDTLNFFRKKEKAETLNESGFISELVASDVNDPGRVRLQILISRWDGAGLESWCDSTPAHTAERRDLTYDLLEVGPDVRDILNELFPRDPSTVVIFGKDGRWRPWYTAARETERTSYWDAYSGVLEASPWFTPTAIARLDSATRSVVERLADPTWEQRFQSKGLVVGYVQSGKTANFTGVIAKAIDAGYRLIIVLTGTVEILRRQTQRRLDMELVGIENILGGIAESDTEKVATTDYCRDQDWLAGKFLRHGIAIHALSEFPSIHRLSTYQGDYRRLRQGLSTLDFRAGHELVDKARPLYDPINLFASDVRLAVVKKNSTVLKRLVDDLSSIHAELGEIPTLIIDDEADQASVNTRRQKSPTPEQKERSAVNQRISDLLRLLKRAQYVGYTATPFANVFVDPDDSQDIFPKDFIVNLERPLGYMGASDFHDLATDFAGKAKTIYNSNEKAFVRDVFGSTADEREEELVSALDSFVISGAVKLYRTSACGMRYRHHTMLVHESVKRVEHAQLAAEIRELWKCAEYDNDNGLTRLRTLYETDFVKVSEALHVRGSATAESAGRPKPKPPLLPRDFDELLGGGFIGQALDKIEAGTSPVIVVNGNSEKDYEQDSLDFQGPNVWKILVGGTKLSRGFTVEGLTTTYYTRRTLQADTLLQMGRWFGFRAGYHDLVRLYLGRAVPAPRGQVVDLYEAFEAVVRDEEDFRAELARYHSINKNSGMPLVLPEDVPPMVFQQVPWLKPTAGSKMYNAELVRQGIGGKLSDFPYQPDRGDGSINALHFAQVGPLLDAASAVGTFEYKDPDSTKSDEYDSFYGIVDAGTVRDIVAQFRWTDTWSFAPHLNFLDEIIGKNLLVDFAILLPSLSGATSRQIGNYSRERPILTRKRRPDRSGFPGSSKRQRSAIETIVGGRTVDDDLDVAGGPVAVGLHTPTRGAMLLTLVSDTEPPARAKDLPLGPVSPGDIATLFSYALPYAAAPTGRIGFRTRKSGGGAIIDRE